jgi:hypothetical protein
MASVRPSRSPEYVREYLSRPYVIAARHATSVKRGRANKLKSTKKRFEEHTFEELISVAQEKCTELGVDFEENKEVIEIVLRLLNTRITI